MIEYTYLVSSTQDTQARQSDNQAGRSPIISNQGKKIQAFQLAQSHAKAHQHKQPKPTSTKSHNNNIHVLVPITRPNKNPNTF